MRARVISVCVYVCVCVCVRVWVGVWVCVGVCVCVYLEYGVNSDCESQDFGSRIHEVFECRPQQIEARLPEAPSAKPPLHTPACVSIRQHTTSRSPIRQTTPA
jgi:hypothetical protein